MEPYDANGSTDISSVIPQGLIETPPQNPPEKNVGESQMAEFSTSLDEIVPPGPGMQMQNMAMGSVPPPNAQMQQQTQSAPHSGKIPFGMTIEQYMACLAGLAAVVAGSKPIQERIGSFFPNVEEGSMTYMLITALVAALVFYAAQRFL
jgi:hypothetical protein